MTIQPTAATVAYLDASVVDLVTGRVSPDRRDASDRAAWPDPWVWPTPAARRAIRDDLAAAIALTLATAVADALARRGDDTPHAAAVAAGDPPPDASQPSLARPWLRATHPATSPWRRDPHPATSPWRRAPKPATRRDRDEVAVDAVGRAAEAVLRELGTAIAARHLAWYDTDEHRAAYAAWTRDVAHAVAHAADHLDLGRQLPTRHTDPDELAAAHARPGVAHAARATVDATRRHAPRGWQLDYDDDHPDDNAHYDVTAAGRATATGLLVACAPHATAVADAATRPADPHVLGRLAHANADPAHVVAAVRGAASPHDAADLLAALAHLH